MQSYDLEWDDLEQNTQDAEERLGLPLLAKLLAGLLADFGSDQYQKFKPNTLDQLLEQTTTRKQGFKILTQPSLVLDRLTISKRGRLLNSDPGLFFARQDRYFPDGLEVPVCLASKFSSLVRHTQYVELYDMTEQPTERTRLWLIRGESILIKQSADLVAGQKCWNEIALQLYFHSVLPDLVAQVTGVFAVVDSVDEPNQGYLYYCCEEPFLRKAQTQLSPRRLPALAEGVRALLQTLAEKQILYWGLCEHRCYWGTDDKVRFHQFRTGGMAFLVTTKARPLERRDSELLHFLRQANAGLTVTDIAGLSNAASLCAALPPDWLRGLRGLLQDVLLRSSWPARVACALWWADVGLTPRPGPLFYAFHYWHNNQTTWASDLRLYRISWRDRKEQATQLAQDTAGLFGSVLYKAHVLQLHPDGRSFRLAGTGEASHKLLLARAKKAADPRAVLRACCFEALQLILANLEQTIPLVGIRSEEAKKDQPATGSADP